MSKLIIALSTIGWCGTLAISDSVQIPNLNEVGFAGFCGILLLMFHRMVNRTLDNAEKQTQAMNSMKEKMHELCNDLKSRPCIAKQKE